MKQRFVCLVEKGVAQVRERELPALKEDEVLVKQLACNICTTDYQQWQGLREHQGYPMAGGHEGCGIVVEIGAGVQELKKGDFVGTMMIHCGVCSGCRSGNENECTAKLPGRGGVKSEDGYYGQFGFADYQIRKEKQCFKMNKELNPSQAGFLEPLATVCKGVQKLRAKPLENVVVIGAGTMGLLNALALRAYGCRVIISEIMEKKLNTCREYGFDVIDSNVSDPVEKVLELTGGVGADAVVVAVGSTPANRQAMEMLKKRDGRVLLFAAGYPAPEIGIDANTVHYKCIEIIGTFSAASRHFQEAAKLLSTGAVDVSRLVEPKKYNLEEAQEAFRAAASPGMYRVSIILNKE